MELRAQALKALISPDIAEKTAEVREIQHNLANCQIDSDCVIGEPEGLPGRPVRPDLVPPGQVPRRSPASAAGLATLLHAICHIEFNAINLALDAVWRFDHMPRAYYSDWLTVAAEEVSHFDMLHRQLQAMGHHYGDFCAHDGLWDMCSRTARDVTARMALVPRTLEARGLDATPLIQQRLRHAGSPDALAVAHLLDTVLHDEVGHVRIGNHWYHWCCQRDGVDPLTHYALLARQHQAPRLRPPFNEAARRHAGFSELELLYLQGDQNPSAT